MSSPVWFMHIMKRTGQWWTAEPHLRCVQTDNSIVQRNNLFSRCWASVGSWGSVLGDIPKCWPIKLVDIPGGLLTVDIEVNWCHHVNFWSVFSSGVRLNTPPFFFFFSASPPLLKNGPSWGVWKLEFSSFSRSNENLPWFYSGIL